MNYIKHLTGFFDRVAHDKLLNPTHVSLYIALFQFWNVNRFRNPISISRHEIMRISKISSLATYHKCLKLLDAHGYIKYEPSFNPYKGSHVFLFNFADDLKPTAKSENTTTSNFKPVDEQVLNKHDTGRETSTEQVDEQALVRYINSTNNINIINDQNSTNVGERSQNFDESNLAFKKGKEEKSSAKKEEISQALADYLSPQNTNPTIDQVLEYFSIQNFPELEANKFFNYFKSNGWLIGGKAPMIDWMAAANKWMLNEHKFNSNATATHSNRVFDTSAGKDYSEPL